MASRRYRSFEQIDQELELLQLQNELLRIRIRQSTGKTLAALSPGNLLLNALGPLGQTLRGSGTLQKLVLMWLAKYLLKR